MPRLAVLGYPVSHSRSPTMQNAALRAMGLDDWSYEAIEVRPEDFKAKVRELAADGKYTGVNVTVPHKEAALAVAGETGEPARQIGAANTLVFAGGGIRAENTDAPGLLAALPGGPQGVRAQSARR